MWVESMTVWFLPRFRIRFRISIICLGFETDRRLVENDYLRISDERLRYADPLAVSLGKIRNNAVAHILYPRDLHHLIEMRAAVESARLELIDEVEVLPDRHLGIKRRLLRKESDPLFRLGRIVEYVEPVDLHLARGRGKIPRQDVHRGGFARTVRPEKSDDLALADGHRDPVERKLFPVPLDEIVYFDHCCHKKTPPSEGRLPFILSCFDSHALYCVRVLYALFHPMRMPDGKKARRALSDRHGGRIFTLYLNCIMHFYTILERTEKVLSEHCQSVPAKPKR